METEENYHITKDGRKILIKDMTTEHLINTIRILKKKAKEGIVIDIGRSPDGDIVYRSGSITISEETALRMMNYYSYKKELERRNLK